MQTQSQQTAFRDIGMYLREIIYVFVDSTQTLSREIKLFHCGNFYRALRFCTGLVTVVEFHLILNWGGLKR